MTTKPANEKEVFGIVAKTKAQEILKKKERNCCAFFSNKSGTITRLSKYNTISKGNINSFGFSQSIAACKAVKNPGFIFVGI